MGKIHELTSYRFFEYQRAFDNIQGSFYQSSRLLCHVSKLEHFLRDPLFELHYQR